MPAPKSLTDLIHDVHPTTQVFQAKKPGPVKFEIQKDISTVETFSPTPFEIYKPTLTEVATEITDKLTADEAAYVANYDPGPGPTPLPIPPYMFVVTYHFPDVWDDGLQYQVSVDLVQGLAVNKAISEKVIEMPLKPT